MVPFELIIHNAFTLQANQTTCKLPNYAHKNRIVRKISTQKKELDFTNLFYSKWNLRFSVVNIKTAIFWDVMLWMCTDISEKPPASNNYPDDGGSRFP
jgi:hypothetical protein